MTARSGARRLVERVQFWNVTEAERQATYGCDAYVASDALLGLRGIDVGAPAAVVFRWVGQLTVAPYSYDWIDNRGRRSPRELTPSADHVGIGDPLMIGPIVAVEPGRELTVVAEGWWQRLLGPVAMSYRVEPHGPDRSRLLCAIRMGESGTWGRRLFGLAALGDLVMMRKQFLNLKECAERSVVQGQTTP